MPMRTFFSLFFFIALFTSCKTEVNNTSLTQTTSEGFYNEVWRPQYHFTPASGWMNDPNGLVYNDGRYHLFYQYYPHSTVWGPMHWGHAMSTDMMHWEHSPIALSPDENGLIFSGSAVVDENNKVLGIITDGDLRRMLEKTADTSNIKAKDLMTSHPKTIGPDEMAFKALNTMREFSISQLIVADEYNQYLGFLHLHDLIREGLI